MQVPLPLFVRILIPVLVTISISTPRRARGIVPVTLFLFCAFHYVQVVAQHSGVNLQHINGAPILSALAVLKTAPAVTVYYVLLLLHSALQSRDKNANAQLICLPDLQGDARGILDLPDLRIVHNLFLVETGALLIQGNRLRDRGL